MTGPSKTNGIKPLSEFEWVRLAASTDEGRPVLTGICARNGHILATDGHRLHVAPNSGALAHGIWSAKGLQKVEGVFVTEDSIGAVLDAPITIRYEARDLLGLLKLVRAAEAISRVYRSPGSFGRVTLLGDDGRVVLSARLVKDALSGAPDGAVAAVISVGSRTSPVRFDLGGDRTAAVMPIRAAVAATDLALDEYLDQLPSPGVAK